MLFLALPEGTRKKWQGDWKLQELWTWQLGSPEQRVLRLATPAAGHTYGWPWLIYSRKCTCCEPCVPTGLICSQMYFG